jgi:hypothetical protein
VGCVPVRVEAHALAGALHDPHHRLVVQAVRVRDPTPAVDRAPERALLAADGLQPGLQRSHRTHLGIRAAGHADDLAGALLIGLAPAQVDDQAVLDHLDVADVERNQLTGAQSAAGRSGAARDRAPARALGQRQQHPAHSSLPVSSAFWPLGAVPSRRRMPFWTWRPCQSAMGGGAKPPPWWNWLIEATRRWMVEALAPASAR